MPGKPKKRATPRLRVLKPGKIIAATSLDVDILILNMTDGGAKLGIPGTVELPDEFALLDCSSNVIYPAKRIWQKSDTAGVAFTGEPRRAFMRRTAGR